ncbi:MAG: photosystem II stability/assembly factor-like protein [Gammaproteobacteria bacterium]|nr:photosystem II stability/assembly factor-like protein [Gammaproteobacteria bacterium]
MSARGWCRGIALAGLGLLSGGPHAADTPVIEAVAAGTAHDALFSIALEGSTALAVGAAGVIVESRDGGVTWRRTQSPTGDGALLGAAIQGERSIVVGQYGRILLRTGDREWRRVESGVDERLFAVALNAAGRAAAVGAFGVILLSNDGGENWSRCSPDWSRHVADGLEPHLYDVTVGEDGAVTVVGELGVILNSADGGASWVQAPGGRRAGDQAEESWFAVHVRADGVGYAVGQQGAVVRTADRGRTWERVDTGSRANLFGVAALPAGHVIIAGMFEMIFSSDDGLSWRPVNGQDASRGWYQGVATAVATDAALLVGQGGRISRVRADLLE